MFKRILIPVDGSVTSDAAVDLGRRFAADQNARLAFVHTYSVARTIAMASGVGTTVLDPSEAVEVERGAGESILRDAVVQVAPFDAESFLEEGDCVGSILAVAQRWGADLIVIGSHGRSGLTRALVGSVAEGVMRRAQIPVLVLHADKHRLEAANARAYVDASAVAGVPHEVDPIC